MSRRFREPVAKPGELIAAYGRVDGELQIGYAWGGAGASKPDSRILMRALEDLPVYEGKTLAEELKARGYDLTTLRFSIRLEPTPSPPEGER